MIDARMLLRALAFAAGKHSKQRRKDAESSPYINHPIEVTSVLADEAGVEDSALLLAAVLHDTVEDTDATFEEVDRLFGAEVVDLVREVSDDKSLPKAERKRLQVEHARSASDRAKQLKIADKICNVRDIALSPPPNWSHSRRMEYLDWSEEVVSGCRGINPRLDNLFDKGLAEARRSLDDQATR